MEVALACVISAGGIGGIFIAVVKLSVASIEKRFERKYTEKFAVFQSDVDKKQYISQVRFDAEFEIYKQLSRPILLKELFVSIKKNYQYIQMNIGVNRIY